MAAKVAVMGMSFQLQRGWRISGTRMTQAKAARQKARSGPGQSSIKWNLAKKPLLLHMTAAESTSSRAENRDGGRDVDWAGAVMPQL